MNRAEKDALLKKAQAEREAQPPIVATPNLDAVTVTAGWGKRIVTLGTFRNLSDAEFFCKIVDTPYGILNLWYADGESAGHVER